MNPYELLAQQNAMEYGPERVAVAEEAVRAADLSGDDEASFDTRMALIETVNMSGQSEKMFAPFAWCQHYAEQHPEYADNYTLAWYHKWLLGAAHQLPQIPLSRIHELHASYAKYARRLGAGASSIPYLQLSLAMHVGDRAAAQRAYTVWQFAKDDMLSDCPACEAQTRVEYHLFMGDDQAALKEGQCIFDKNMTCGHMPHLTYSTLLLPLLRAGNAAKAAEYSQRGRELVEGDPDFLETQAEHLEYLTLTDINAALKWYEQHLPWAEQTRELKAKMVFHRAAALLFQHLNKSERLGYHHAEAAKLAKLFDARNGTDHYTQQLAPFGELV